MARDYYSGDDYVGISFLLVEVQLVALDPLLWMLPFSSFVIPSQQAVDAFRSMWTLER